MMNLNWNGEPQPTEILKLLVAIPEKFSSSQIFDKMIKGDSNYVFKGMICYQDAHYIAFFRRMLIKLDYLAGNPDTVRSDIKKMESEITKQTEWTLFDDSLIESKGSWTDLVEHCIQNKVYPTVLMYEKLDPEERYPASKYQ